MKSISFDNPYLLLIALPLLLVTIISYLVAIRKDNKTKGTVISLALHIVIIFLVAIAVAETTYTRVITKTEVVVVADVSYSADGSIDAVDDRIRDIEDSLIGNSSLAVVTFGGDYELHTSFGEKIRTVRESDVDTSRTDIVSALEYASTLFSDNTIKRVVLITDARSTDATADDRLVQTVDNLFLMDVQVDAIFLDSNLKEGESEVQITSVDYNKSTYHGHLSTADVLVTASEDTRAIITLYKGDTAVSVRTEQLTRGFNILNFELDTQADGVFDYKITAEVERDSCEENNSFVFTQHVSGNLRVLLVSSKSEDLAAAEKIYGENATIDFFNSTRSKNPITLPYTVEEMIKYDEILLSDVDVRVLPNYTSFINSVDQAVSQFGKSLVTFGNNNIQNKTEEVIANLQNMLPVNFGNDDRDAKLMTLVLDCSRSMEFVDRERVTKEIAKSILDILDDEDRVAIVVFWGDNYTAVRPTPASERESLKATIDSLENYQGTMIGSALETAYELMRVLDYADKQLVLISDGLSYVKEAESDTAVVAARNMRANGIVVSTVQVISPTAEAATTMKSIAAAGQGRYYNIESEKGFEEIFETQIADDVTESVIQKQTSVNTVRKSDDLLDGITAIPDVYGYTYARTKVNATTVLTVNYEKAEGGIVEVPLYAYWKYGNGRVSSFTSSLSGEWISGWDSGDGAAILNNIALTNVPEKKQDYPFNLNIDTDGSFAFVELIPATLKVDATALLTVTSPSGAVTEYTLIFDSTKFYYNVETNETGRYDFNINYSYSDKSYSAFTTVNVAYSSEYDSFASYRDTLLYKALRNRGKVVASDTVPEYEYDESRLTTYVISFTVPFLIAAAVLYVIDVIVRKLKWSDIKGLFGRKRKEKIK